ALFANSASADPLYFLTLEASSDGGATWTTDLNVQANTTYMYQAILTENGIGTSNSNNANYHITSIGPTNASGTTVDGVNSFSFNVTDTGGSATPVTFGGGTAAQNGNATTLASTWAQGSSANAGTLTAGNTGITGIRPLAASGQFRGAGT